MNQGSSAEKLGDYLTVGEAAEFLGVSTDTLRNWDKAGKLRPTRHPKNGYRIYRQAELKAVLEFGASEETRKSPAVEEGKGHTASDHFVQFYDDDAVLVDSVCSFMGEGLIKGEAALVIATESHRQAIEKELKERGLDLSAARGRGQYVALDAAMVLDQFMVGGAPDAIRFAKVIGDVLTPLARGWRQTRAFGEMVALLWADGNRQAAVRLEELWNDIAKSYSFSLFCAYPMNGFAGQDHEELFSHICKEHSRVIPPEDYAALSEEDRTWAITLLEQKARSLEAEIARRKEVEDSLRRRERELADFFENASEGLHKVGPNGVILWANRAELELTGYRAEEYIGHHITEFHDDQEGIKDMLARLLRGETLYNYPARLRCRDGSIKHVLVHSNACFEGGRFAFTRCFTRDITAHHEAEEQLRAAKAVAEQASRAKDQFLAVLSHELRTPLTPVLMSVAAMETEPGLPPRLREDLAMIRRNIALETRLIDDLLDLSRVINGKMPLHRQDVDVHVMMNNVVEMVAGDAKAKQIELRLDLRAEADRVHADSARIHQVLWNLLHNAIKFTPERGTITMRSLGGQSDRLVIEVQDTGMGIDAEVLPSIFNAFDQGQHALNRTFGGLGLGLAISKAVIDLHHGTISAMSPGTNCGSTFTLSLPLAHVGRLAGQKSDAAAGNLKVEDKKVRSLKILLVDDHADTLKVLRRLLEIEGHAVTPACTVTNALEVAAGRRFDLVLSDIGLPDGTGLELLRQIRQDNPNLPAIAMTGFGMEQDIRNSHDAGFATHLTKPIDICSLRKAILQVSTGVGPGGTRT